MKLLLDENLSPRLVARLNSLFTGLIHVRDVGLKQASDQLIWDWAKENAHSLITADADFLRISHFAGPPPKVIFIEQCDFPFRVMENLLRRNALQISEFEKDSEAAVLTLRLKP